ncbi:MAG: DUF2007 domain-containing protein [Nitrospinota bacterium]
MDYFSYLLALILLIVFFGYRLLRLRRDGHGSRTVFPAGDGRALRDQRRRSGESTVSSEAVSPDESFVKFQPVPDLGTAYVLKGFLEVNGVPCLIRGESRYTEAITPHHGVHLLVPESRLADARRLIEELDSEHHN